MRLVFWGVQLGTGDVTPYSVTHMALVRLFLSNTPRRDGHGALHGALALYDSLAFSLGEICNKPLSFPCFLYV